MPRTTSWLHLRLGACAASSPEAPQPAGPSLRLGVAALAYEMRIAGLRGRAQLGSGQLDELRRDLVVLARERGDERVVAEHVDHARDAAREAVHGPLGRAREEVALRVAG